MKDGDDCVVMGVSGSRVRVGSCTVECRAKYSVNDLNWRERSRRRECLFFFLAKKLVL